MSISRLWIPSNHILPYQHVLIDQRTLPDNPRNYDPFREFLNMSPLYYIREISKKYFVRSLVYEAWVHGYFKSIDRDIIEISTEKVMAIINSPSGEFIGDTINVIPQPDTYRVIRNNVILEQYLYSRVYRRTITKKT